MAKKRRKYRANRQEPPRRPSEADVEQMIVIASQAYRANDLDQFEEAIALLADGPPQAGAGGPALVDALLAKSLGYAVVRAWMNGWQPADLVRSTRRSFNRTTAELVVDIIAADMATYATATVHPDWQQQVTDLGATVWWTDDESHLAQWARRRSLRRVEALRVATPVLGFLHHLPTLPLLCPLPGEPESPGASRNGRWGVPKAASSPELERIRALLTKAESTTFPEEAEALSAKAQQLMAALSIDRIALAPDGAANRPIGRRLGIDDPYASAKSLLLDKVASANLCRSVWTPDLGFATVFGDEDDVASVDILFTSLLTQATAALRVADRRRQEARAGRARSFRQSFHVAYALRIGARLEEVMAATEAAAEESLGRDLLPVLASHADDVDDAVHSAFPGMVSKSISASNRAGWFSGVAAADAARLSTSHEVSETSST